MDPVEGAVFHRSTLLVSESDNPGSTGEYRTPSRDVIGGLRWERWYEEKRRLRSGGGGVDAGEERFKGIDRK